jgi:hypothetical protein
MLQAGSDKLEVLGLFPDPKKGGSVASCTSPALANGRLYVRLLDCLACYDLTEAGNKPGATSSPDKP